MILCKNCTHLRDEDLCARGMVATVDPVTGITVMGNTGWRSTARGQRDEDWLGCRINRTCGQEARWFEPKRTGG